MKKLLLVASVFLMTGCTNEESYSRLTYVKERAGEEPFIKAVFEDQSGHTVELNAHQIYRKVLKEGKVYNLITESDRWGRPDNEITSLDREGIDYLDRGRK